MNHGCDAVAQRLSHELSFQTLLPHSVADRVDLLRDCRRALELQMKLKRLLLGERLPAMRALVRAIQLDPDILETSIARLGAGTDLHRLRHLPTSRREPMFLSWLDAHWRL